MTQCWVLLHQNDVDHDVIKTPLNLTYVGAFESEATAKASVNEPQRLWTTHEDGIRRMWSGHDQYWLVRVW